MKGKTKTILEYPFKSDVAGRIYFTKEQNKYQIYRMSTAKDGSGKLTQ